MWVKEFESKECVIITLSQENVGNGTLILMMQVNEPGVIGFDQFSPGCHEVGLQSEVIIFDSLLSVTNFRLWGSSCQNNADMA